ncbi:MAG TPA: ABC transporter substrate-binding protein [Terriglobia bacterium]|nr:ABC transporter substrate-binding protein [Terriglobia bacterium]
MIPRISLVALLTLAVAVPAGFTQQRGLQQVKINYPARSGGSWPLFIAKEGGYYQKYGLDVTLEFGAGNLGVAAITGGGAVMTNSSMEQALQASSRSPKELVSMGSFLNKGVFALMAVKGINSVKDLKGKRIAVAQVGDAVYNYTIAFLSNSGIGARDVTWVPVGNDASARGAALQGGRADATLLTAPAYFEMEEKGFKNLGNLADQKDVYASSVYLVTRKTVAANPRLPELILRAQTEAIKRFYDDRAFAVKAFLAYERTAEPEDVERIYDLYAKSRAFERVPYVLADAVKAVVAQAAEEQATQMKAIDFRTVVDNSAVDRLVKEGFFEKTFGASVKAEQESRSKQAMR